MIINENKKIRLKTKNKYCTDDIDIIVGVPSSLKKLLDYTKSCGNMFRENKTIVDLTGYIEYENTSNVTDMSNMFYGCFNLTTIPLLNTSNVTNMSLMFQGCSNLTTIPLLNTSNVTDMSNMFSQCSKLTTIPLLNTSNVTNMYAMFSRCSNLTTIPLLNTSNVTDMSNMFSQCSKLTTIPLLNTSNVTNMSLMFKGCTNLTTIPQLDTSNVTNMNDMFSQCSKLTNLTLLNIKVNLQVGSGSSWGHLLTLESLLGLCQECINVGSSRTLTVGTANMTKLADIYVKLTGEAEVDSTLPKLPMVQCESTDDGAMTITDYMLSKGWNLA